MSQESGDTQEVVGEGNDTLSPLAEKLGYPTEALQLVLHVISDIGEYLDGDDMPDGDHLAASHLANAVIACAKKGYGRGGRRLLRMWKLDESASLGALVIGLVDAGLMRAHPSDSLADFDGLYSPDSLDEEFTSMSMPGNAHAEDGRERRSIPALLHKHLGPQGIAEIVITEREFPFHVRADLQHALDEVIGTDIETKHFSGVRKRYCSPMEGLGFSSLIHYEDEDTAVAVPPEYEEMDVGDAEPVRCLKNGLWLIVSGGTSLGVLMSPHVKYQDVCGLRIQIAAPRSAGGAEQASSLFAKLEEAVRKSQSYRGKILSLEQAHAYSGRSSGIRVHRLATVERDQVILPASTLELLERNVLRFVDQRSEMAAYGVMAKKGVLFYGPPGTGKTHTIHYLAHALKLHTTFLMSAEQVGLLDEYMALVRLLQPSVLVMEDVDLIARERTTMHGPCEEVLLNKLLNEMDGLREDAEVLFILTTNRPQMLEPALASRPGRIDQAIEFPMPDEAGRQQLIHLYARDIALTDGLVARIARKTEGASGAFIKELMRRSLQFCIERTGAGSIALEDVEQAIEEMLFRGGSLNRALLGVGEGSIEDDCDE
ncbi:MAG: AAA family ATPase [bacterium]|nr:AAA family ATPase [bacterium]